MIFALLWIGVAYLVGMLGEDRKFGLWGTFAVSILFSPLVGLLTIFASDPRPRPRCRCLRHRSA